MGGVRRKLRGRIDAGPPPSPTDTCTSAPALASQPGTYTATGTTASQTNDYSASCNPGSNSDHAGRDVVYRLVLDAPRPFQHALAIVRKQKPPRCAHKKARAQLFLKGRDAAARARFIESSPL